VNATVIVLAKAPVAGRVKTRCCPPCTAAGAAELAAVALTDTLCSVALSSAARCVLVLEGSLADGVPVVLPDGVEVLPQRGDGLDERLAAAFADAGGPALLVGMDTPQLTPAVVDHAGRMLLDGAVEAVLGPAADGGYWAIGLRRADPMVFLGVPMSRPDTGWHQRRRLRHLGLGTGMLPTLRDVDTWDDALAVASSVPRSRFAAAVDDVRLELAAAR
jgi:rSAM/selenodomain-associated transferase 1